MSPSPAGRRRAVGIQRSRLLFGAAAAILLVVGAGGAQAAGGALDPSFGRGGKVSTDVGIKSWDVASAVAVQADGKIVVAGWSAAKTSNDFALVRYTTSGKLDASFGRGGKVLTSLGIEGNDLANAVVVQPDGKIIAAGSSDKHMVEGPGTSDFALVRYTTSGTLDASFGKGGKVVTDVGGGHDDEAHAVAVQTDGKIVAAGESPGGFTLVRYTADGKLDASFGLGGKVETNFGKWYDVIRAVAVQKDGKIVAAGYTGVTLTSNTEDDDFALARYTTGGKLDASFGRGGKVRTDLGARSADYAYAMAIQADGKIVVAGTSALVRYLPNGRLDASFGRGGKALIDFGGEAIAVTIQRDGKIVAAGTDNDDFVLVRLTTSGKVDARFGRGGKVLTNFGGDDNASAVVIQRDGKIIAAGTAYRSGSDRNADFCLARYLP